MVSRWGYETATRDRVAEAEQLLLSHRFARPVVRELGSTPAPVHRAPAAPWPANLGIVSSVGVVISADRGVVGAAEW